MAGRAIPTPGVVTVKGPRDYSATAKRVSGGIISLDPLGLIARGQYELAPPGGAWDTVDNGRYEIFIDPAVVRDRQGQSPDNPVGHRIVQILPTPPPPPASLKAEVAVAMADGRWTADVSFENTGGWSQAQWGGATLRGPVFFASAVLTKAPTDSLAPVPSNFSHRYSLGELKPGHYMFVFRSSAGHIGHANLTVPGVEPPGPFEAWKFNVLRASAFNDAASADTADTDSDGQSTLAEFVLGGGPNEGDNPDYQVRVVTWPGGAKPLALTFRRALGSESSVTTHVAMSSDLKNWQPGGDQIEISNGPPELDGTQTVMACQTIPLASSRYPYLRLRFEKKTE